MNGYSRVRVILLDGQGQPIGIWRDIPEGDVTIKFATVVIYRQHGFEAYKDGELEKAFNGCIETVSVPASRVYIIK